ncbi:uncharacterized protein CCR75_006074 [Bremia lactucae]|uniref:Uncharacterized protein n=1 Tax=Bremia lactucae TaxID=4779 RepID=A0A976FGV8_BRELC|nr:hypothetical protein CCR75_006074 [Bremia lactucae]
MEKISVHALRGAYQLLHLQEQNEEVQPQPPNVADVVLPSMEAALKRIADGYDDSEGYRKRMLLERVLEVSNDVVVRDPKREAGQQGQHALAIRV